jgi:hypothetical protein
MLELYNKDTLVSNYVDGLILPLQLSKVTEDRHLRYDKTALSTICPRWMLDTHIKYIFSAIQNLNYEFKVTDHQTRYPLYERIRKFQSASHLIEFFYKRTNHHRYINVSGYIRVTVRHKKPEDYVNHVILLLELENILSNYWCHVCSLEMALDCLSEEDFKQVANKVILKYSRVKDIFHCDGSRSKTGKILKIPGHKTTGNLTNYFNGRRSSKQLKSYTIADIMENQDSQTILCLRRKRIELSFNRSFLKREGLNTFSQILAIGPDLFFNQIELIEFNKKYMFNNLRKNKDKRINKLLYNFSERRWENLLKQSSAEVLKKLSDLLPSLGTYRIKQTLGKQVEFPSFVFDMPHTCNNNIATNQQKY